MTTQALTLPDNRTLIIGSALPLAGVLIVALTALVDHLLERFRDPAGILPVVDLRTARRALARVARLDLESTASGAAAYRHLMSVKTWAAAERHYGRTRRRVVIAGVLNDAQSQLAAMGHPGDAPAARVVEPRDGALASPRRYVGGAPSFEAMRRPDAVRWHRDT